MGKQLFASDEKKNRAGKQGERREDRGEGVENMDVGESASSTAPQIFS